MSKKNPLQKWVLPLVMDPPRICAVVRVPNDIQHIGAFYGALYELTRWYNWQEDPAHLAVLAAAPWKEIFDQIVLGDCATIAGDDMQFRQNGCKLEFSLDCVNWNTLYDPTGCIGSATTQPPAGGALAPNECIEYDVVLNANNKWRMPIPVDDGYTITISGSAGGWSDGTANWNCPDGVPYILGVCVGAGAPSGGDPAPLVDHMRLIAVLGTGQTIDAFDDSFTIPGGTGSTSLDLQANDSNLADNFGSVHCHVKVCATPIPAWCYTFDFLTSDGGFAGYDSASPVWTSGSGWQGGGANGDRTYLSKNVSSASHIHTVEAVFASAFISSDNIALQWFVDGVLSGLPIPFVGGPTVLMTLDVDIATNYATAFEHSDANVSPIAFLESLTFRGTGVNPWGSDNCT